MRMCLLGVSLSALVLAACGEAADTTTEAETTDTAAAEMATEASSTPEAELAGMATELCEGFGPQTPRDITSTVGTNPVMFELAPEPAQMNLCNIHSHTNAEHKGPDFSVFVGDGVNGGYACNATDSLTEAELAPYEGEAAFGGVVPGETIEVHWVFSSCDITPGEGLGSCLSDTCENPLLRVEAQTFLVVNDPNAIDFTTLDYSGSANDAGLHQPAALPTGTGDR